MAIDFALKIKFEMCSKTQYTHANKTSETKEMYANLSLAQNILMRKFFIPEKSTSVTLMPIDHHLAMEIGASIVDAFVK